MNYKSVKVNYLYNLSYQILILLTPLITTPYISRVLGADGIGSVSFAESIVSYFSLIAVLGITTFGQREIAYVRDSLYKRSVVFWNTKLLEILTSAISLVLYLIFAFNQDNKELFLCLSLNIIAVIADITWFFQGLEEFKVIVFRNFIVKIISIVYIFIFVKTANDLLLYVFGLAGFPVISNISLWFYLPSNIVKVKHRDIHPFRYFPAVIALFIPTVAIQIYTVLDKTMIGLITKNAFENGYYEQALKISKMALTIVTALGTVMIPRIGYYFGQQNDKEVKRLLYNAYRFVWFLGAPICFGLISVSSNFVPWFFGVGYNEVIKLLKILSFLILAIGINNVTGMQYLIPTKKQNIFTLTVIVGALLNFIVNSLLIPTYGATGAAISSVLAESTIAIIQLIIVRKEISILNVFYSGLKYIIAAIIMGTIVSLASRNLNPTILSTTLLVGMGGILYFGILILLRDPFFKYNLKSIMIKLFKSN